MMGIITTVLAAAQEFIASAAQRWTTLSALVEGRFGMMGKWFFWIATIVCLLFIVTHAARAAFNIVCYVIIPAAALSVLLLVLLPALSPMRTFPVLLGVTSVMLVARAR